MQRLIRALWPMVLWMGVVFTMSTEVGSPAHSSAILEALLRWLDPGISAEAFGRLHFLARKAGHVTEYAVLAILILRAARVLCDVPVSRWSWRLASLALFASAAYGATDEFHQVFVPTRGPSVHDVVIDSCGAAFGLLLAFLWVRRRDGEPATAARQS